WTEVHPEAEELEHAISDKLLEKMDEFLGRPTVDPHGDPIPSATGEIERRDLRPLSRCRAAERLRIARVDNQDAAFLQYATDHGLRPGAIVTVVTADPVAGAITLRNSDGQLTALGLIAAEAIFASPA
ncbi:MAG TPA: metal-dependent transcriptional regulator, partial [Tepidisphaeraceae bacterium]